MNEVRTYHETEWAVRRWDRFNGERTVEPKSFCQFWRTVLLYATVQQLLAPLAWVQRGVPAVNLPGVPVPDAARQAGRLLRNAALLVLWGGFRTVSFATRPLRRAAGFTGAVNYEFSDQGNLVFVPGTGANFGGETSSLAWVDRQGAVETLPFAPQAFNNPRLSPDGTRIAVEINDGEVTQIWILEVERGGSQPLTVEGSNTNPVWSHDGEWVYFASDRGAGVDIWRKRADRSAAAEPVLEAEEVQIPYSVSADGELLLFFSFGSQNPDIWILSLAGDAEPEQLIATAAATYAPYVSPDGRLVAFTTDESGNREVSVAEIATGRLWPISIGTGRNPVWSRDGSEIFYYGGGGRWYSVDVTHDPDFSAASPQELFRMTPGTDDFLDISADAQKFLIRQAGDVAETPTEPSTPRISVVLNWFEELAQRVPTGR